MDGLPPVSEDKQWRWRLAPLDQKESTETKLSDVHSLRTTAQGCQITTDSTQDGHRGKTLTLPKKENQGAAAQDFRLVGQVQWRRDHRQSFTEEVRQDLRRPVMIWHQEDLTIHWLCICCVILSTYNATEKILFKQMISEPWLCLYLNIGNRLLKEQLK